MVPPGDKVMIAAVNDLSRRVLPVLLFERAPLQTLFQQMNLAADSASAPLLLFIDEGVRLSPGWDEPLLRTLRSAADIGVVLPVAFPTPKESPAAVPPVPRCFLVRRPLFAEGLGFSEDFAMAGGVWNFLLALRQLNYRTVRCPDVTRDLRPAETAAELTPENLQLLSRRWPDFPRQAAELAGLAALAPEPAAPVAVDWTGSFLDHGSLSQVNRELTAVLQSSPKVRLQRVSNGAAAAPGFESLAREIAPAASAAPAVTVRHAWPPDWRRPARGKLVVIQPWEFGLLPAEWVQQSAQVDEFWVPSDYVRQVYAESGVPAGKVVVVPNGVNPQRFHPQAAPAKLATTKRFKFLFVGGTIFRKGPDVLLQAYLANFTAADEVCLVIKDFGGRSVYAGQTFEAKIRAAQAQPNAPEILYINEELPPDDLPGIYTACDCLVLPYRGEGFGLPVLEAMACGRPVIVTSGGATDDFVRDDFAWRIPARRQIFGHEISGLKLAGAGWLLEPDAEALGRFLREAVAQPGETRRRGERAAQHARQFFTWAQAGAFAAQRLQALGRALPETATVPAPQAAPAAPVKITLPPAALIGHLAGARDLLRQKKARAAWEAVLAALAKRPFHPEAYLLLAEIALTVGAGRIARLCAEHARHLAPDWKPAKKLLNQRFNGTAQPEWLKLPAELPTPEAERRPRLTVCLIVKNEEKFLGRCLDSVRGLASQIVVVDTGSTDRTVAIALEHGAEIHEFAWTDDFSAARNAALEHATGDWVLMLDADEELTAEGREKLPLAMANPAVMAWRLPLMDVGREANGFTYVPRFYRNAPALFYLGRVHEQVFSSVEVRCAEWGLANRIGDAPLIHHGYTDAMMRDRNKVARNLRLLERAIEELPGEPHLLMHLGLELTRSGRATEGLERDLEAFTILSARPAREVVPELRETLLMQVGAHLTAARRFDEVARVLTSPLAELGGGLTASLHFSLGLAQFELRRFREAADQMRQCLAKRLQPTCTSINQEIKTAAPHLCLAMCLDRAGDPAGTEAAYQAGLAETGLDTSLRREYARWLAGQNRLVEALQQLHQLVTQQNQDLAAWQLGGQIALSRPQFLKFARDWTEEALQRRPEDPLLLAQRAEVLLLSEDLAAALPLWEQLWVQTAQPGALAALILCETVEALTTHAPDEGTEEAAVSRAFIQWYRKLLAVKGQKTMMRLNAQTEKLGRALPMAARMLDAAMGEAARAAA